VCFCEAPPRSGTVCGTVRSSPALERTAFLWKYTKSGYEFLSQVNANSVFKLSFLCNRDSAYENVLLYIQVKVIFTDFVCYSDKFLRNRYGQSVKCRSLVDSL
jgi:hypothetical protein